VKLWHWLLVAAAGYEALVGAAEILSATSSTGSTPLGSLATLPSVGSLAQQAAPAQISNPIAGGLDIVVAGALFFYPLHKHLLKA
jgi:hypothetical protein